MDSHEIHAFVQRDWHRLDTLKATYWAERFRQDWRTTWRVAQALLDHARRVRRPFPTEGERAADFTAHLVLQSRLDRAAHAFARR